MSGVILIYSCQKYKETRVRELDALHDSYEGWRVFIVVGDPTLSSAYTLEGRILTLKCEDSYLHLLKKTLLGFKVAIELVPTATGILKCGDDIVFNESEMIRFLRHQHKYDYMGSPGGPAIPLGVAHRDPWIVDYYRRHPEDFGNPLHGLPSWDVVSTLTQVPTIQAASGPLTYFSRRSADLLVSHMDAIQWDVLREEAPYGYPYIIEEPGISYILYPHGIRPTPYTLFTESRTLFQQKPFVGLHTNAYKWSGPTRVCILGSGWYGCHAARVLQANGIYVHILDKDGIFTGSSAYNQNRLHLGYHYPRSPVTIRECQVGHARFLAEYGECVRPVPKNTYLLHDDSSLSVDAYRVAVDSIGRHREYSVTDLEIPVRSVASTVFNVDECYIDAKAVRHRMERELTPVFERQDSPQIEMEESGVRVNGLLYDYVLNCTNNQYRPIPVPHVPTYETVCSFLYHVPFPEPMGLTVMDGPFFSIFPYDLESNLYTLTHVHHSVVYRGTSLSKETPSPETIEEARRQAEAAALSVFPSLSELWSYRGHFLSLKSKYDYVTDDRSLRWMRSGRYFSFSGGKITGIFEMENILKETILSPQTLV